MGVDGRRFGRPSTAVEAVDRPGCAKPVYRVDSSRLFARYGGRALSSAPTIALSHVLPVPLTHIRGAPSHARCGPLAGDMCGSRRRPRIEEHHLLGREPSSCRFQREEQQRVDLRGEAPGPAAGSCSYGHEARLRREGRRWEVGVCVSGQGRHSMRACLLLVAVSV